MLRHLLALRVPRRDDPGGRLGEVAHDVLQRLHQGDACRDDAVVATVADGYDDSTSRRLRAFVERHRERCPGRVERGRHEVDLARFHHRPAPMFIATATIDAIWVHDGIADARDYKTGRVELEAVADDPAARVQAWVLALHARRQGLRPRLSYECLAAGTSDDPAPFEPEDDDLEAVEEELRTMAWSMHEEDREGRWRGVRAAEVCRFCEFAPFCVDAEMPAPP